MESRFVTTGEKAIDFHYQNPFGGENTLSEKVKAAKKTCLIFLRYYGCTICQLDMKAYREQYAKFTDKDAQILLVLQSQPSTIAGGIDENYFGFEIACDPQQELYKAYQIASAKNKLGLASIKTIKKMQAAKKSGLEHGAYEGNEMQLPAVFVLDSDMNVLYAHRAKNAGDMPEIDELVAKL